eukprot:CAMPEP_0115005038 /NCGR_PEP_ID=MMETSP0216-20121206/19612_1 /TAXON_ID=223996 /ORGANISM="Protocruzia adherens, Strain Boccale" /LENGTH=198 /DNA_ID=CAMNT_0002371245 /DNA_START=123 /DNA_END=719 /DNA_ORIENTATION=+
MTKGTFLLTLLAVLFTAVSCQWRSKYYLFNKGTQTNVCFFGGPGSNGMVLQAVETNAIVTFGYSFCEFDITVDRDPTVVIKSGPYYIRAPGSQTTWVDGQTYVADWEQFTITPESTNFYTIKSHHGWYLSTTGREVYQKPTVTDNERWLLFEISTGAPSFLETSRLANKKQSFLSVQHDDDEEEYEELEEEEMLPAPQ